jgi:adenylate cyclase
MSELHTWLLSEAPDLGIPDFVTGLVERLKRSGVPVDRFWLSVLQKHPIFASEAMIWTAADGVTHAALPFEERGRVNSGVGNEHLLPDFRRWEYVNTAEDPPGTLDLPRALWEAGYVEVAAARRQLHLQGPSVEHHFVQFQGFFLTLSTRHPDGFGPKAVAVLEAMDLPLQACIRMRAAMAFAQTLAHTYLGKDPGNQVLAGRVHLGESTEVHAAVAFTDLRGFTRMTERERPAVVFDLLNDYYRALVEPIASSGGDVLQFMGDGLLAIWTAPNHDPTEVCNRALNAARDMMARVDEINVQRVAEGKLPIRWGLSLDHGPVTYGNMGAPLRLAFSVLGPTVNRAARLESIGAKLGRMPVLSAPFAKHAAAASESLGFHPAKGVGDIEVFAPLFHAAAAGLEGKGHG